MRKLFAKHVTRWRHQCGSQKTAASLKAGEADRRVEPSSAIIYILVPPLVLCVSLFVVPAAQGNTHGCLPVTYRTRATSSIYQVSTASIYAFEVGNETELV